MTVWRAIDTGVRSARWNIAMTAALGELHRAGGTPDTIRFHRYARSVLLGCNEEAQSACDTAFCRAQGIEIARRVTGGGAVYMSPAILAWDIVAARVRFGRRMDDAFAAVGRAVAQALRALGLDAAHLPPGDVRVGALKISGSGGRFDGGVFLHQGTVLVAHDAAEMAAALRMPADARTASVAMLAGRTVSVGEVQHALAVAFGESLGDMVPGDLSPHEIALADRLLHEGVGDAGRAIEAVL